VKIMPLQNTRQPATRRTRHARTCQQVVDMGHMQWPHKQQGLDQPALTAHCPAPHRAYASSLTMSCPLPEHRQCCTSARCLHPTRWTCSLSLQPRQAEPVPESSSVSLQTASQLWKPLVCRAMCCMRHCLQPKRCVKHTTACMAIPAGLPLTDPTICRPGGSRSVKPLGDGDGSVPTLILHTSMTAGSRTAHQPHIRWDGEPARAVGPWDTPASSWLTGCAAAPAAVEGMLLQDLATHSLMV
jgi:hypothetical protein